MKLLNEKIVDEDLRYKKRLMSYMRKLGIPLTQSLDYVNDGKLHIYTNGGSPKLLTDNFLLSFIDSIRNRYGVDIFCVLHDTHSHIGNNYSFLIYSEELGDIVYNYSMCYAYVFNFGCPDCSEFGLIALKNFDGNLKRVY